MFRKDGDQRIYDKARKRLDKVPAPQVSDWAYAAIWEMQPGLENATDAAGLAQAKQGALMMLAAIDSLLDRQG